VLTSDSSDQQAAGDFLIFRTVQPRAKRPDLFAQNINAHFLRTAAVRVLRSELPLPAPCEGDLWFDVPGPERPFIAGSMSHCSATELATGAQVFHSIARQ